MSVILRIVTFTFRKYKFSMALAYISVVGAAVFALGIPRVVGDSVDNVLREGGTSASDLWVLALLLLMIGMGRGLFMYGQTYLGEYISQAVAYDLRNAYYDRLQRLSFAFHDKQQTGNLMSRATADVEGVRMFMNMGAVRAGFIVAMLIGISILMLFTHVQLALVTLSFIPLIGIRAVIMSRKLRSSWLKVQELTGEMVTVLQENLSGIRVVKAFAAETHEKDKFRDEVRQVADETMNAERLAATSIATMGFAFIAATGIILWFGGQQVVNETLTVGELMEFIMYMGLMAMPIRMIGWLVNTFSRAASCGQRIFEILDEDSPVQERVDALEAGRVKGRVVFDNVKFEYEPDIPVLRGINIEVEPGKTIALLGAPGCGKSTLVSLLPRFYDVTSGRITIDGIDIRDMSLESLRRNVGVVQQDVFIHMASIKNNISYGALNAPFEKILEVSRISQMHDFIDGLAAKYETPVGERGVSLSGGQRQRLSIARTLLVDPPVLILDDSTSSVDAHTEHQIQLALDAVMRGRTTFVITHRLSTIRGADTILVMKDGIVVEQGNHTTLLELGGEYKKMYDLQLRSQEEAALRQSQQVSVEDAVASGQEGEN